MIALARKVFIASLPNGGHRLRSDPRVATAFCLISRPTNTSDAATATIPISSTKPLNLLCCSIGHPWFMDGWVQHMRGTVLAASLGSVCPSGCVRLSVNADVVSK